MAKHRRKASNLLINAKFQGLVLLLMLGFGCVLFIFHTLAFKLSIYQLNQVINNTESLPQSSRGEILNFVHQINQQTMLYDTFIFMVTMIIFLILGIRITHNAAGALHRFKSEFKKMEENKTLHEFHLRKGDFFKDVQESFNQMVEAVKSKNG